ncbi:MAG: MFS transporter [Acidimicrobiia bacterium]|nr:MFS transporter [Acidimicrobiia bacterium]
MTPALVRLTAAKTVANTALRWIPPFLPTLERAFGATTTQLTTVIGLGEAAGLSTIAVGRHLDRRRERLVMVGGLLAISASASIALIGTLGSFALSFAVLIVGVSNFTVAGHAWISHRVDYRWRARSIGLFETSWALALLVGAPLIAILISVVGWRGPFGAIAVASAAAAILLVFRLPEESETKGDDTAAPTPAENAGVEHAGTEQARSERMSMRAWFVIAGSSTMAMAGLSVFVVSGTWLHDSFGVSTGGLGMIAMTFGAVELAASTGTAAFADRLGKLRSTLAGLVVLTIGLVIMLSAGDRLLVGVCGLLIFLLGFEFGFVTSLSLISEAGPTARGRTLSIAAAVGTVARGSGTILSGWLYGIHGISGTAALSAAAATVALVSFALSRRGAPVGT